MHPHHGSRIQTRTSTNCYRTTIAFTERLVVFNWNVRGLCSEGKRLELKKALEYHRPHVVTLQETWFKPNTKFFIDSHRIFRVDRSDGRNGGGVAILVRRDMSVKSIKSPSAKPFEVVTIAVSLRNTIIYISSLYSPNHTTTFKRRLAKLMDIENHFIFGDFNARHQVWNNSATNLAGRELYDMVSTNNIAVMHPPVNTYCSPTADHTESTIDHLVTNSTLHTFGTGRS